MQNKASKNQRYFSSAAAFIVFCALAGGSSEESSEEKKTRFMKSEDISSSTYDTRVKDFGSYEEYKNAAKKGMNPQQYAQYKAQIAACKDEWKKCLDNEQLVNNWSGWVNVQVACKMAANDKAKYGEPEWPWLAFSTFQAGKSYISSGKAVAIERDAKFQNGFNAKVRVRVLCTYNLDLRRVDDVVVVDR